MSHFRNHPTFNLFRVFSVLFLTTIGALVFSHVRAELIYNQVSGHSVKGDFLITPNGETVVYKSKFDRLYSVSIKGGSATEIGFSSGMVEDFALSPDGSRVVFKQIIEGQTNLYSAPTLGGEAIQLNGNLVPEGHVYQFQISPDGTLVLYLADQETNDLEELYTVPLLGGDSVKLNHPLYSIGNPDEFDKVHNQQFSPDNKNVVFVVQSKINQTHDLFSVPATGGDVTKLNLPILSPVGTFEFFMEFEISPDSQHVLYLADQETADQYELYQVPISGGEQTKLNGPLYEDGDVGWVRYSPDGNYILYIANPESESKHELYSRSVVSGDTVKLTVPSVLLTDLPELAASGDWLVYPGYIEEIKSYALFSSPLAFEKHTQLTPNPSSDRSDTNQNTYFGYQISEDGNTVVFHADHETEDTFQLYSVPIEGGKATKLNGPLVDGGDVTNRQRIPLGQFLISPDSSRVVYIADQEVDDRFELFSTPLQGGPVTKLNDVLSTFGDVDRGFAPHFKFSPDSNRVVYVADQELEDHLYASIITPIFISESKPVALLNRPYSYTITADDVDDPATLHFLAETLPAWLTLVDNGAGQAQLTGTPTTADIGLHDVVLKVTNGDELIDTQTFTLQVDEVVTVNYLPAVQNND